MPFLPNTAGNSKSRAPQGSNPRKRPSTSASHHAERPKIQKHASTEDTNNDTNDKKDDRPTIDHYLTLTIDEVSEIIKISETEEVEDFINMALKSIESLDKPLYPLFRCDLKRWK